MTSLAVKDGVLRCMLPEEDKQRFKSACRRRGVKMSERVRELIEQDIREIKTAEVQLAAILASAKRKNLAGGLPTPTIEDIDAFIDEVRTERIRTGLIS